MWSHDSLDALLAAFIAYQRGEGPRVRSRAAMTIRQSDSRPRMAERLEHRVVKLVHDLHGGGIEPTPAWMIRPGRKECGRRWVLVQNIYETSLAWSCRRPCRPGNAGVWTLSSTSAVSLRECSSSTRSSTSTPTAPRPCVSTRGVSYWRSQELWIQRSEQKRRLEGGGFARPKPPLFPCNGGRHRERAFRDALADILPMVPGWLPTLRMADFEVQSWIHGPEATQRMDQLLGQRLGQAG
jgi:hypothetical protein